MSDKGANGWQIFTLADAYKEREPESAEAAYRRGYCDGWIQAVEAMHDLMFDRRLSRQAAYEQAWDHWQGALAKWRHGDTSAVVWPPAINAGTSVQLTDLHQFHAGDRVMHVLSRRQGTIRGRAGDWSKPDERLYYTVNFINHGPSVCHADELAPL